MPALNRATVRTTASSSDRQGRSRRRGDQGALGPAAHITLDGKARNALTYGTNPIRYKYSGSPYLGTRYNSCAGTIRIYFGGLLGTTHYNLKTVIPNTGQVEVAGGSRRVVTRAETSWGQFSYAVQGCKRGGLFSSSACTRWSPTVTLIVPREAAAD